jgi:predicted TIM-barrel fold metal-dependent hydrolase
MGTRKKKATNLRCDERSASFQSSTAISTSTIVMRCAMACSVNPAPVSRSWSATMPICSLACSFGQLYSAYGEIIEGFTLAEKRRMLHDTAGQLYGVLQP